MPQEDKNNKAGAATLPPELLKEVQKISKALTKPTANKIQDEESKRELLLIEALDLMLYANGGKIEGKELDNLLEKLEDILGMPNKKQAKKKIPKVEQENRLKKEQRELKERLMIYEIYKVLNPNRLAGETELENFVNNVRARGVKEALKYEGSQLYNKFFAQDLENLQSHKHTFQADLQKKGHKGFGPGM
jgi:hypothetical protein